jgi:hypothetical protein
VAMFPHLASASQMVISTLVSSLYPSGRHPQPSAFCLLDDPCLVICARVSYTHECHDWIQWYVLVLPRPQWPPQPTATNYGSVPATSQPYIQTPDGSQVQWSSFRFVNYIIHDGWRVGLTGDYIVEAVSMNELCMVA